MLVREEAHNSFSTFKKLIKKIKLCSLKPLRIFYSVESEKMFICKVPICPRPFMEKVPNCISQWGRRKDGKSKEKETALLHLSSIGFLFKQLIRIST